MQQCPRPRSSAREGLTGCRKKDDTADVKRKISSIMVTNLLSLKNSLLDHVASRTDSFIASMPKEVRKAYGQFFTSKEAAMFMAGLYDIPSKRKVSVLDAGCGSGILTAALVQRLANEEEATYIEVTCYETDEKVLPLLKENLEWIKNHCCKSLSYRVIKENYILSQSLEYNDSLNQFTPCKYDLIIGNPPYMKIPKDAPEARAMSDVCHGAPNLYFLFVSMGMFNLRDSGELVYIIPRSWVSGAYFARFREKLFRTGALTHIHLFVSRDKVFDSESVLQETMIVKIRKTTFRPACINITTSHSNKDFSTMTAFSAPYDVVVSGPEKYVYLVTNEQDVAILQTLNTLPCTLPEVGMRMKTGLTVDFRTRESLRDKYCEGAVPLLYSQHLRNGRVKFPAGKSGEYLVSDQKSLKQQNCNYLLVKRFTSKEERRRLQCAVYLAESLPDYAYISTQNKINFIGSGQAPLSEDMVYGLYVLFNSTIYDLYYRILNGSTQVNSTEMNQMPVPTYAEIERLGRLLKAEKNWERVDTCDKIVNSQIFGGA